MHRSVLNVAKDTLKELADAYELLLKRQGDLPPPSEYAHTWAEWQGRTKTILCLRPTERQGLPLPLLDDAFCQFKREATKPVSDRKLEAAAVARRVATTLCQSMGEPFENEGARGTKFVECLKPLFGTGDWTKQFYIDPPTETRTAKVDGCFRINGVVYILREDKIENGEAHDAYMQIVRDFHMYVENLREDDPTLQSGAPTFLVCVIGTFGYTSICSPSN